MSRALLTLSLVLVVACGSSGVAPSSDVPTPRPTATRSASPSAPATPDVLADPSVDGTYAVAGDGGELAIRCFGQGSPTIVFEAGSDSSGIDAFGPTLLRPLAETNQTCVYDRLGTGVSDRPTADRRTLDEVIADLAALLPAAKVAAPYLLVGQSAGGNIAIWYAANHPEDVAGLVLIDVGKDDPEMMAEEFPGELSWGGSEHVDWLDGAQKQAAMAMPIGDFPVLIITADEGQGDPSTPSGWRALSPRAREIIKHGGHDLHEEIPEEIAAEIRAVLADL